MFLCEMGSGFGETGDIPPPRIPRNKYPTPPPPPNPWDGKLSPPSRNEADGIFK